MTDRLVRITALLGALALCGPATAQEFLRGDANSDRSVSVADADYIFKWLFLGHDAPDCLRSADVDTSAMVNITVTMLMATNAPKMA